MKAFIYFIAVLVIAIGIGFTTDFINIEKVEETIVTLPGYCFLEKHPYGVGQFSVANEPDMVLFATSEGYEVWAPCK